jgi:2'-5' RNA ligase
MRLFFAITITEELVRKIGEAQNRLRAKIGEEGVRWTKPEQFHYTLKFLGEQPAHRTQQAIDAGFAICDGLKPFDMTLGGLGAFPNAQRPGVLWIGASQGGERFTELAESLDALLARLNFPREHKPLSAHLTLARIKGYAGEKAAVRALRSESIEDLDRITIDRFVLMSSLPTKSGSEYTLVEEFKFKC